MDGMLLVKALIALTPVGLLLVLFDRLDVFNVIRMRTILTLVAVGAAIATVSFIANWRVMDGFPIGMGNYSRYVAPIVEETLKVTPLLWLFFRNRIGFKLDAAIAGFAIGAGFSVIENLWYLFTLPDTNVSAWLVRGFGTAVMHGGATALFAVISHEMTERQAEASAATYRFNPLLFLPGLGLAIVIHSAFNHLGSQPLLAMAATLMLIPATLFLTFARNDRAARQWLKADQARHIQLLADIRAGRFAETDEGHALKALAAKLPPQRADALMAYAELSIEMVLRAEELILAAQESGSVSITDADREKLRQLASSERELGAAVVEAVSAALGLTRNDLWELQSFRRRAFTFVR
jgi:RsiW-degrading membrane proteinase PrsW (M82 family)